MVIKLTPRQAQILALLATGMTRRQAARHLGLALSTIKNNTAEILGILDAPNVTGAVTKAIQLGILDLAEIDPAPEAEALAEQPAPEAAALPDGQPAQVATGGRINGRE